jgi:hypothetical protein
MRWTSLLNLQNRHWWLYCELANQLEFSVRERRHQGNLNRNWTTSVLQSRDKTQVVVFENGEEAIDG